MTLPNARRGQRRWSALACLALAGCASGGNAWSPQDPPLPLPSPPPVARSGPTAAPASTGPWQGRTHAGKHGDVFTALSAGAAPSLQYGAPLKCRLDLRAEGAQAYAVENSNGGWCDRALAGSLRTTPHADGTVSIELRDDTGAPLGAGDLSAAP